MAGMFNFPFTYLTNINIILVDGHIFQHVVLFNPSSKYTGESFH